MKRNSNITNNSEKHGTATTDEKLDNMTTKRHNRPIKRPKRPASPHFLYGDGMTFKPPLDDIRDTD